MTAGNSAATGTAKRLIEGGISAGLVGGTVLAIGLVITHAASRQDPMVVLKIAAYPFLGARVLRPGFDGPAVALGVLAHYFVSVVWGILFALIVDGFSWLTTLLLGAIYGVVVWLGMFLVVLPVFAPDLDRGAGSTGLSLSHVLFGLGVAVGFLPFQRSAPFSQPVQPARPAMGAG